MAASCRCLFGDVNEATVRVLRRNGCDVVFPKNQICCGALNIHNGESVAAKQMARHNIDVFLEADVDAIVVNSAGCGAAMKEYGYLLRDDPAYAKRRSVSARWSRTPVNFLGISALRASFVPSISPLHTRIPAISPTANASAANRGNYYSRSPA